MLFFPPLYPLKGTFAEQNVDYFYNSRTSIASFRGLGAEEKGIDIYKLIMYTYLLQIPDILMFLFPELIPGNKDSEVFI